MVERVDRCQFVTLSVYQVEHTAARRGRYASGRRQSSCSRHLHKQRVHSCSLVAWNGMVNVDLYSAIIAKVSNALNTLVSGEKPGAQFTKYLTIYDSDLKRVKTSFRNIVS